MKQLQLVVVATVFTLLATASAILWLSRDTQRRAALSAEEFYTDGELTIYVGNPPGGGHDIHGRLVARHIGKHLPGNPRVVVSNMPGAGGLRLANWLEEAGPTDGSAIAVLHRQNGFLGLFSEQAQVRFDVHAVNWIGSPTTSTGVCVVRADADIRRFDEVFERELIIGISTEPEDSYMLAINEILGTRFSAVSGYQGSAEITMALLRGEVDGRCGWTWESWQAVDLQRLEDGELFLLVQLGQAKHPQLADVPRVYDYADTAQQRQLLRLLLARQEIGIPFLAAADVPADRVEVLREAFAATMKDPAYLEDARRMLVSVSPISPQRIAQVIREAYSADPSLLNRLREIHH